MSVGVAILDKDHRKLVDMINDLYDSIQEGRGKDVVGKFLEGLISYTEEHFRREEKMFMKSEYPDVSRHMALHDAMSKQVAIIQENYKNEEASTLSMEVMNFIKNWLINHIMGTDMNYSPYLNGKGSK
jgi:hemerythrin